VSELHLAPGFSIPAAQVATQTFAILAKRGAGKTGAAAVMAEEMHAAGVPFVVVDPVGSWWGLRSSVDGKKQGLPIPILGGHHGDVPLERGSAELVADLIIDETLSCVLDVSALESEAAKRQFLAAFADRLFRQKGRPGKDAPLHLFLEEADDYAPQRAGRDVAKCLGAFQRIVKQGRARGLGATMITQRSAVLNKDLLTQIETLIVLRTTSPQDRKAIGEWVSTHGQAKELLDSLTELRDGEAWVWSAWLNLVKRIQFRRRSTYDSGATPTLAARRAPATLADIDLGALRDRMQATIERAQDEDPKALKKRVAELERRLATRAAPAIDDSELRSSIAQLEATLDRKSARIQRLEEYTGALTARIDQGREIVRLLVDVLRNGDHPPVGEDARPPADAGDVRNPPASSRAVRTKPVARNTRATPSVQREPTSEELPKGEATILTAVCQYPDGVDRQQISILTGYKRSSRDTYIQRLRGRGLIEIQGSMVVAAAGAEAWLGDFEPLPTGEDLQAFWLDRLPTGEALILRALIDHHPDPLARDYLSEITGYKRSSRDTYIQRLKARKIIEVDGAMIRAADLLFQE